MKRVYRVSAGEVSYLVIAKNKRKARKHVEKESVYSEVTPIDSVERVKSKRSEILGTYKNGDFFAPVLNVVNAISMQNDGAICLNHLDAAGVELTEEQLQKLRDYANKVDHQMA